LLAESLRSGRAAHAYLLAGPRGIGKTAVALEFAQLLLCEREDLTPCGECIQCRSFASLQHPDVKILFPLPPKKSGASEDEEKEFSAQIGKVIGALADDRYAPTRIPGAKEIRLGFTRSVLRATAMKPYQAKRKVFVILHADGMNEESQNALLKALEEPYPESYFLLVTENEIGLRPTIRSRCQRIRMAPLSFDEVFNALLMDNIPREQAELAARMSGGSIVHGRELADPEIETVQNSVLEFLRKAAFCDPHELPLAAEGLLHSDQLPEFAGLEMLALFLRDAAAFRAVSESGRAHQLTFGNLQDKIHGVISAYPHADFEQAVKAVDESTTYLTRGYTKDMILYSLAIRLNKALGPLVKTKRATPITT
jgi:DNA polymerase-3 subunit delta'